MELRGDELTVSGNIEANVFDGTVVASHLRLADPLGKWPRFYADVRARNLDLDLVTRAFAVGTITGRLDADILGLELFNWSPVAFDARLETAAGDRSRHRISAKAVKELSNVGGGGGGVTQALQSGVLRFFDTRAGAGAYRDPANDRLLPPFRFGPVEFRLEAGQCVVFPSYVYHEVAPFHGADRRITVATNCWFT